MSHWNSVLENILNIKPTEYQTDTIHNSPISYQCRYIATVIYSHHCWHCAPYKYTYTIHFNGHFPVKLGMAGYPGRLQSSSSITSSRDRPKRCWSRWVRLPTGYFKVYPTHSHLPPHKGPQITSYYRLDDVPITQPASSKHRTLHYKRLYYLQMKTHHNWWYKAHLGVKFLLYVDIIGSCTNVI